MAVNVVRRLRVALRGFMGFGMLVFPAALPIRAEPVSLTMSRQGELKTLDEVRDRLRSMRVAGELAEGAQVTIEAGEYPVAEPIVFLPEDSGTEQGPIVFRGKGQAIIHGGRVISNWKQEGPLWVAEIPEVRDGNWSFSALWVNGERRQPARTPNAKNPWGDEPEESDTFRTAGPVAEPRDGDEQAKSATRFQFHPADLHGMQHLDQAVFVIFHSWETSLMRLRHLDETNQIVEFTGPAAWHYGYWEPNQRYFIEHLRDGLDQPGEWCLDKSAGKLFYMPMPGERPDTVEAVAPVARQLLVLEGDPAHGKFVQHLHFQNLTFRYTEYPIAETGYSDSQAAFSVNAALQATGALHCRVADCRIERVGNYGVWLRSGSRHNRLERCELFDLGAGGVRIGEGESPASEDTAADHNLVDNNFIHDGGRIFRSAVGVWIGRSSHNQVTHNEICDFRYTGVSVGWSWGYAPSSAHHNLIADNHIHHIGHGQLNDMGAIYCLGIAPGTVLRGNLIHDVDSHPRLYGGWGIYTDEGSSEIVIENNVVYRVRTGTFHQHYGKDNRVRNNILALSATPQIVRSREEEHNSFFFERNIVYLNNGSLLGGTWKNGHWKSDNNLFWDASGAPLDFAGRTWEQWQAEGHDSHSLVADPRFVDPEHGDFHLQSGSPATQIGFELFAIEKAGLYGDPEWVAKPGLVQR